jgi:hypothetical protein
MFATELTQAGHTRRFTITHAGPSGWEVRVEQDDSVVRQVCYSDWHRVERAFNAIAAQVSELKACGWRETLRLGPDGPRSGRALSSRS